MSRPAWTLALTLAGACGFTAPDNGDVDGPMPLTVGFLSASTLQDEASGSIFVPVALSEPASGQVTVRYVFTGGTATKGADFTGTDGVLTFGPGDTQQSIPLTILSDAEMEDDETIGIELRSPTNALVGLDQHDVTISSNILARIQFTAGSSSDQENISPTLMLTLDRPAPSGASVDFVIGGNASSADYTLTAGTLVITAGASTAPLVLPIVDDPNDEYDEHVVLTLTNSSGVVVAATTPAHDHTIVDNDAEPTVSFTTATRTETERDTGLQPVGLEVRLSAASGKEVKVSFTRAGTSTAIEGQDFDYVVIPFTPKQLKFDPGDVSKTILVNLRQDNIDEDNEDAITTLTSPMNATLGPTAQHTMTITDDDPTPAVRWGNPGSITANEGNQNTTHTYNLVLSNPSSKTITVPVTVGGTATSGSDYNQPSATATFTPGQTSRSFALTIIGDDQDEPDETVTLTIGTPTNAVQDNNNQTRTHTIVDDDT